MEFKLKNGDSVDFDDGYTLVLKSFDNKLCGSNYNRNMKCFWQGQIIGHFRLYYPDDSYDDFSLTTNNNENNKININDMIIRISGYEAGRSRGDATLYVSIKYIDY